MKSFVDRNYKIDANGRYYTTKTKSELALSKLQMGIEINEELYKRWGSEQYLIENQEISKKILDMEQKIKKENEKNGRV